MDRDDPLRRFRDEFHIPLAADGHEEIYLTGNSLGLQPKRTKEYIREELDAWAAVGVRGHFEARHAWLTYHELLAAPMAAIVGAEPLEVVTMNSLTVNLHLMMVSFYRPTSKRHRILIEEQAFPSDHYAVESQIRFHGRDPAASLVLVRRRGEDGCLSSDEIVNLIRKEGDSIALVLLPGVHYYTGEVLDLEQITRAAREAGCAIGFDLAHAAGNVVMNLSESEPDFACWCTYKYLNSGPGSVAACFVAERHAHRTELPRFAGWWGHDKATRFLMGPEFHPIPGAEGWQLSNPPILSLAAIRASLDVFMEAGGMEPLRRKSEALTGYLEWLLDSELQGEIRIITPRAPALRGCQLSLEVTSKRKTGREVYQKLEASGVSCDWREPNVIRAAPTPLYNTFTDVYRFVELLKSTLG
jgi:kynureninase